MAYEERIPYGVNSRKAVQLISAGFIASMAMMVVAYLLRGLNIPAPDFATQYGAILNGQSHPDPFSGMWWTGFIWHTINGTFIFSFLYDFLSSRLNFRNLRSRKGLLYGIGIWLFVSAIVAPLAGEGFFFRLMQAPVMMASSALLSWIVYGLVLDSMTRVRVAHRLKIAEKRAA